MRLARKRPDADSGAGEWAAYAHQLEKENDRLRSELAALELHVEQQFEDAAEIYNDLCSYRSMHPPTDEAA